MTMTFFEQNPEFVWRAARTYLLLLAMLVVGGGGAAAHTPTVEGFLTDWCVGAPSNGAAAGGRVEDSAVQLSCGNCSTTTNRACKLNSDCPGGETCVNLGSKTEVAFWDNRTDGAVNDLGTVVMTQNATNLYVGAELWVDPDPVSLPFGEIAIDFKPGGVSEWHDPNRVLKAPGRCSVSTDRACTSNADCQFCQISDEPTGGCSVTTTQSCVSNAQCPGGETCIRRVRPCGSACDPGIGDRCQKAYCSVSTTIKCGVNADCPAGETCNLANPVQTCVGVAEGARNVGIGRSASPEGKADFLLVFDFSNWLVSLPSVRLMRPWAPGDPVDPLTPWVPVTGAGCPGGAGCDYSAGVNPGASGGSGGPPGSVEVAIPWSAFVGSGFGPGVPFRFTMTVARGNSTFDFKPDGAHEDVLSEPVAVTTTTTTSSCPGFGIATTACELANGSLDALLPRTPSLPHEAAPGGRIVALRANKSGASIALNWFPSCSTADTNYEVYEGTIGTWYSHLPVTCATGGTTSTFAPAAGNRYYLVVPTNGASEGSYGKTSASIERPVSSSACVPQSLGTCP